LYDNRTGFCDRGFATGAEDEARGESGQHWGLKYCPTYLLDGRSRLAALGRLRLSLDDVRCATKRPSDPFRIIAAWKREMPYVAHHISPAFKIMISSVTGGQPHLHDNEKVMLSRPVRS